MMVWESRRSNLQCLLMLVRSADLCLTDEQLAEMMRLQTRSCTKPARTSKAAAGQASTSKVCTHSCRNSKGSSNEERTEKNLRRQGKLSLHRLNTAAVRIRNDFPPSELICAVDMFNWTFIIDAHVLLRVIASA
eukprot:scaffold82939_cov22-Tisochrysis_lutea.AAC.2